MRPSRGGAARLLPLVIVVLGAGLLLLFLPRPSPRPRLLVAASVPPQEWLVRRIGRDRVEIDVLLPPGTDPHTYEPTPQQVARMAGAGLVVAVDHPSFLFEQRLLDVLATRSPPPVVVSMSRHAQLLPSGDGESDPHIWLSPAVMKETAREVAAAFEKLDPGAAGLYRGSLDGVLADIEAVDGELRRTLAGLSGRRFLVYHPAWGYLARDYGLEQVAIEAGGKEPSPRRLVELVEQARRDGTRVVFVQRGSSEQPARAFARELGARVVVLDPMAADWPANLRRVGVQVREALGG